MQHEASHSHVVPRMMSSGCGMCGAQMKLGANDTGRLFNWHPVRFALAPFFCFKFLCGLYCAAARCPLSSSTARQVLMALAFPVFMAEVTTLSRHCIRTPVGCLSGAWQIYKHYLHSPAALAAVLCMEFRQVGYPHGYLSRGVGSFWSGFPSLATRRYSLQVYEQEQDMSEALALVRHHSMPQRWLAYLRSNTGNN